MAILFFIVFIDLVGFGMIIPLLPFYAEHFGADPFVVGLVMASYSLAQFAAAPFWGRLSDRVGRRPVLIVSLAGGAAAYVWLGYADELWILFAARLAGGAMAGNISAAFAYMADITTPENRAKGMGLIGAAFGLGFIAGPALGGLLAGSDPALADYRTPALAAAGLSFLALGMSFAVLKESLSQEVRRRLAEKPRAQRWAQFRAALAQPKVIRLIGLTFLATFVFAGMEATFALWSNRRFGWGPAQNGYLFAFVGILSATIQGGFIGRLAKKFGEARLIIFGTGALAIGLGLIPFSTSLTLSFGGDDLPRHRFFGDVAVPQQPCFPSGRRRRPGRHNGGKPLGQYAGPGPRSRLGGLPVRDAWPELAVFQRRPADGIGVSPGDPRSQAVFDQGRAA